MPEETTNQSTPSTTPDSGKTGGGLENVISHVAGEAASKAVEELEAINPGSTATETPTEPETPLDKSDPVLEEVKALREQLSQAVESAETGATKPDPLTDQQRQSFVDQFSDALEKDPAGTISQVVNYHLQQQLQTALSPYQDDLKSVRTSRMINEAMYDPETKAVRKDWNEILPEARKVMQEWEKEGNPILHIPADKMNTVLQAYHVARSRKMAEITTNQATSVVNRALSATEAFVESGGTQTPADSQPTPQQTLIDTLGLGKSKEFSGYEVSPESRRALAKSG